MNKHCFISGCAGGPHFGFGSLRGGTMRFACAAHKNNLWMGAAVSPETSALLPAVEGVAVTPSTVASQGRLL